MPLDHPLVEMFQNAVANDNISQATIAAERAAAEGLDMSRVASEKIPVWRDPLEVATSKEMVDLIVRLRLMGVS